MGRWTNSLIMFRRILCSLFLASALRLSAVQLGDTLAQVLTEKGKADGEMNGGSMKILNYADLTVKLKDGKVVEITEVEEPLPGDSTKPAPAAKSNLPAKTYPLIKPGEWTVNCRQATAQARKEKRRVLLLFTGSDWSAFSQRFYKEIVSTPEFAHYAIDNLILVEIDFPKKIEQSPALKAQNQALLKIFKVERYPTVVLLNSDGKLLGTLPFEEGGVTKFLDSVKKL